ncbi:hypothetical protein FZI85_03340 [Mycobacterium sp. CBMA293]|nr:hypothetical protein [Mycolicibacterium sp. CBMA 360]MUL58345.1 hypothetical protein [Mycolicibacterium sp. CBMA 335]MUL73803.1 hypothetical protein [Mycolicibacterium sp. CBMA 311]MUL93228.1 hypothetical protein [Mycolicibacterium sp. CBMA 230]MUM07776.1 hypothetical protein [Mycolicibacterium sp. CBMA 213]MUM10071.1 hypothetical protein [Mycolicibacterium sp. CBMA 293]
MRNTGVDPTNPIGWALAFAEFGTMSPRLRARNRRSVELVVGNGTANVSLTSYGKRISTVWQTIETIGAGTVKPRRLILWLDDSAAIAHPPAHLKRLQARGLEIRQCRDYGPHKKYFPYVNEILPDEPERTLVTADDDVYYPPNWLEELLGAHRSGEVTAFRARIRRDGPYSTWPMCTTTAPSEEVFATGVSGIAYPPELLSVLRDRGDAFTQVCPRADDYWLHYAAVATGIPIRQVRDVAAYFWPIVMVSNRGLWDGQGTANDAIAEQTRRAWLSGDRRPTTVNI